MQSVFRTLLERLRILRLNVITSYQLDTAYVFEAWGNMMSTLVYTASYLAFIAVVYANVDTLAGYTRNEMMLLAFMAQATYYCLAAWSIENAKDLIKDVNRGDLDLVLIRPMPALFYLTFRRIYLMGLLRDALIPMVLISTLINWPELGLTWTAVLAGIVVALAGQWALHVIHFLFAFPVFWLGESDNIFTITYALSSLDVVPYEGLTNPLKWLFTLAIPIFIPSAMAASVMLGHIDPLGAAVYAVGVALLFTIIKALLWRAALRAYTSASS